MGCGALSDSSRAEKREGESCGLVAFIDPVVSCALHAFKNKTQLESSHPSFALLVYSLVQNLSIGFRFEPVK